MHLVEFEVKEARVEAVRDVDFPARAADGGEQGGVAGQIGVELNADKIDGLPGAGKPAHGHPGLIDEESRARADVEARFPCLDGQQLERKRIHRGRALHFLANQTDISFLKQIDEVVFGIAANKFAILMPVAAEPLDNSPQPRPCDAVPFKNRFQGRRTGGGFSRPRQKAQRRQRADLVEKRVLRVLPLDAVQGRLNCGQSLVHFRIFQIVWK